ncbi:MAG: hypothetical protein O3A02_02010 [bacterium]|nr:hypothetical protein [bacterium]
MWFRRAPRAPTRADRWAAFAATIEAQSADAASERLRRFLDLDDAELLHAHVLRRSGQASLYLFDVVRRRVGPSGQVVRWATWALVRSDRPLSPVSFRVAPRREAVLESLEASRTGATRVDLAARPEVDAALAVLARDPTAARSLLTPAVTDVLERMVSVGSVAVVVGERHLLAQVDTEEDADPAEVMPLAADLLALSALLPSPPTVTIDEDDFPMPG